MRYSFVLALLLFFCTPSINAIIMNGEGLTTSCGFIKWEQLVNLPQQMNTLENKVKILQVCVVLSAAALIYMNWFNTPQTANKKDVNKNIEC